MQHTSGLHMREIQDAPHKEDYPRVTSNANHTLGMHGSTLPLAMESTRPLAVTVVALASSRPATGDAGVVLDMANQKKQLGVLKIICRRRLR
jgi:hypothetical protein